ncbi:MAG: SinI family restriction endonuclease [Candidatus Margulisiibacteriota bacterium]
MSDKLDKEIAKIKKGYPDFDWEKSGFDVIYKCWKTHVVDANKTTLQPFIKKFIDGYNNRPSVRVSKESLTVPDQIIDKLISARIPQFTERDIKLIKFGHRLSMAAENILGYILEEFIHNKAIGHGWACCWGNCITSVDFCSSHEMLQVKNRSNTENSSSNKIRKGTEIKKWFRVNATNGRTNWLALDMIIGVNQLFSEKDFIDYAKALIKSNPAVLFVEQEQINELFSD